MMGGAIPVDRNAIQCVDKMYRTVVDFVARLKLRKCTKREHHAKADLECNIVLYRTTQIDTLHVSLHAFVRHKVDSVAFRSLYARDEKSYEQY